VRLLLFLVFLFCAFKSVAQSDSTNRNRWFAYPVAFYSPETKLGFGLAGSYSFRFKNDSIKSFPSQITFGAAYTTNKQVLLYAPFRIYAFNQRFLTYGELGYYRFTYNFYGIGNSIPTDYSEKYLTYFTRLRFNLLYQFTSHIYIGPRVWFEDQNIREFESGRLLDTASIAGSKGSRTPGFGITANIDFRNNLFYPTKGWFAEFAIQTFQKSLGSTLNWTRYLSDVSIYLPIANRSVLAFNGIIDFNFGNPPFNLMAALGGTKRMRGYYEGRFRDNNAIVIQSEFRSHIKGRFGFTVFASLGAVSHVISEFAYAPIRSTAGAGLRFRIDRKEKLNLRLDLALGKNSQAIYFTVGEAF
jgi:outer membrane protein assembly factor BamA